jgi:hypothetical protein
MPEEGVGPSGPSTSSSRASSGQSPGPPLDGSDPPSRIRWKWIVRLLTPVLLAAIGLACQLTFALVMVVVAALQWRQARKFTAVGDTAIGATRRFKHRYGWLAVCGLVVLMLGVSAIAIDTRPLVITTTVIALVYITTYFVFQQDLLLDKKTSEMNRLLPETGRVRWLIERVDDALTPSIRGWVIAEDGSFEPPRLLVVIVALSIVASALIVTGATPRGTSTISGVLVAKLEHLDSRSGSSDSGAKAPGKKSVSGPSSQGQSGTSEGGGSGGAGASGGSAPDQSLGSPPCSEDAINTELALMDLPGDTTTQMYNAWSVYQTTIGCAYAGSYQSGGMWIVPLSSGSDGDTWLIGNQEFGSVLFGNDFAGQIIALSASLQSVEPWYRWGFGTAQLVTNPNGSCSLFEKYVRSDAIQLPPSVTNVIAQNAYKLGGYPDVVESTGNNNQYSVTVYVPDASSYTGAKSAGQFVVSYDQSHHYASGPNGTSATDSDACSQDVGLIQSFGSDLVPYVNAAPAFAMPSS